MAVLLRPDDIASAGQAIFQKHRREWEALYAGQFIAIDITTEKPYPAAHPEIALKNAMEHSPEGAFHLVKVGSLGAFKVSYPPHARRQRLLRERKSSS